MGRTRESANLVSDKNIFVDIANDFVGIGTTAPTATLEVSGTLAVSGVSTFQTHVHLGDSDELRFGAGDDLKIYHDGTSNIFLGNGTADFKIQDANHSSAIFDTSAAVQLYYDNSEKFRTKSDGIDVTGEVQCDSLDVDGVANISSVLTMQSYIQGTGTLNLYGSSSSSSPLALDTDGNVTLQGNLDLQDDDKILLGTGDDLQIYHNGSNSFIQDVGTGILYIQSDGSGIDLQKVGGENLARFLTDGAVELYYDNSKKFETTSGGVEVTGSATATSFSGSGANLTNVPTGFSPINFVLS